MDTIISTVLNVPREKLLLQQEITKWFSKTKEYLEIVPAEFNSQVELLSSIRKDVYEDLNQLQHVALIIRVAEELQIEYPQVNNWYWHAKQTSHPNFADLTGYVDDTVFLNAEVTTSLKPVGTIDQRMKSTLLSLDKKQGLKFYFVLTEEMFRRAVAKKTKNGFNIEIKKL